MMVTPLTHKSRVTNLFNTVLLLKYEFREHIYNPQFPTASGVCWQVYLNGEWTGSTLLENSKHFKTTYL